MKFTLSGIALAAVLAGCASAPSNFSYTVPDQPEGSSGYTEKPGWATRKFAVAAANPLATDPAAIAAIKVSETWVNGERKFAA